MILLFSDNIYITAPAPKSSERTRDSLCLVQTSRCTTSRWFRNIQLVKYIIVCQFESFVEWLDKYEEISIHFLHHRARSIQEMRPHQVKDEGDYVWSVWEFWVLWNDKIWDMKIYPSTGERWGWLRVRSRNLHGADTSGVFSTFGLRPEHKHIFLSFNTLFKQIVFVII